MEVRVVRSRKRRKTISASVEAGQLVVRIPSTFSKAQEQKWVDRMYERVTRKLTAKKKPDPDQLTERTEALNRRYFEGKLRFSIAWVSNQKSRWGSCTSLTGEIRLSEQLKPFPAYVIDYVIVHELAHILEANHGPRFWELVNVYPQTERARGFLEGYALARQWDGAEDNF